MNETLTKEQFIAKMQSLTEQELVAVAASCFCFICGHALVNKKFEDAYDHTVRAMEARDQSLAELLNNGFKTHYVNQ